MLDRQQRDELVASLQSVEELWETAAGVNVVQNNIIIEMLRVADDACREDYPLLVVFFIRDYFGYSLGSLDVEEFVCR